MVSLWDDTKKCRKYHDFCSAACLVEWSAKQTKQPTVVGVGVENGQVVFDAPNKMSPELALWFAAELITIARRTIFGRPA